MNKSDFEKLCRSAGIKLKEDEVDFMIEGVNDIDHFIAQLKEVDGESAKPLINPSSHTPKLRIDEQGTPSCDSESMFSNTPKFELGYICTPKVV